MQMLLNQILLKERLSVPYPIPKEKKLQTKSQYDLNFNFNIWQRPRRFSGLPVLSPLGLIGSTHLLIAKSRDVDIVEIVNNSLFLIDVCRSWGGLHQTTSFC